MSNPKPLSPAAQAVMDAVLNETAPLSEQRQQRTDAAAALYAAAHYLSHGRRQLAAIATELEKHHG
jgi:hypothetical protein